MRGAWHQEHSPRYGRRSRLESECRARLSTRAGVDRRIRRVLRLQELTGCGSESVSIEGDDNPKGVQRRNTAREERAARSHGWVCPPISAPTMSAERPVGKTCVSMFRYRGTPAN